MATKLSLREKRAKIKSLELKNEAKALELAHARKVGEATDFTLREASISSAFIDRDSSPWFDMLSYATGDAIDQNVQIEMQRKAYQAWSIDSFYHGLVEIMVRFIGSTRTKLVAVDEDPKTQEALDDYCRDRRMPDGRIEKGFTLRFEEQVRRYIRDGEYFKRRFVNEIDGTIMRRFCNPLWIRSSGQFNDSFGIACNPQDIEHVYSYSYWDGPPMPGGGINRQKVTYIPAIDMLHDKNGDSDAKRGRPYLLPVTQKLLNLRELLKSRLKFHWLTTLYGIQRKVSGGGDYMAAMIARQQAAVNNTTGTKIKAPADGNIVNMTPGVEIDIKTAMLHAIDADADIRRIIYEICMCLGISYTVGSGDPSQANYNAGTQQENPMLKTMDSLQGKLAPKAELEGEEVLEKLVETRMLPRASFKRKVEVSQGLEGVSPSIIKKSTETCERCTRVKVEYPDIMERDVVKETNALAIQLGLEIVDKDTARVLAGYDPEEIKRKLKIQHIEEAERNEQLMAQQGGGMAGNELMATLKTGSRNGNGNGTRERQQALAE